MRRADAALPPTSSITSSSPPWAKLAVIQTGMPNPPQEILMRFEQAFTKLERRCPDEPARIGDFLYSGYNSLTKAGKSVTLLELTESVATMLETAAGHGGIPKMKSCAEPVALMVTALLGS
jgi:hypothetical protein